MTIYYTYLLRDPRNFEPIYVGKGCNGRMFKHWANMLSGKPGGALKLYRKLTSIFRDGYTAPIYERLLQCEDEKVCFLLESFMIKTIGRDTLCNLTSGGEGASGSIQSEETRRKIGEWNLGRRYSAETLQKMSKSRTGSSMSESTRLAIKKAIVGKKHTTEALQNMRDAAVKRWSSAEYREKQSLALRGRTFSAEHRRNISKAALNRRAKLRQEVTLCG